MLNLFRLLENETLKIFSIWERRKSKNKFGGTKFWKRIHVGMDEMYENFYQATYRFFGIDEMYKLVMDEMYEIVWIWIFWNWEHKLCVSGKTHVDAVVLVVWVVFIWFVVCHLWLIKLGCIRRRCVMNILNFGLSPLCLVYMKFFMA